MSDDIPHWKKEDLVYAIGKAYTRDRKRLKTVSAWKTIASGHNYIVKKKEDAYALIQFGGVHPIVETFKYREQIEDYISERAYALGLNFTHSGMRLKKRTAKKYVLDKYKLNRRQKRFITYCRANSITRFTTTEYQKITKTFSTRLSQLDIRALVKMKFVDSQGTTKRTLTFI